MKFKITFFILLTCAFAQDVTLTFDCPDEVVAGSEENVLTINMENNIYLDGIQMELDLGTTDIELTDVINGNILPSFNTTSFVLDSTYLTILTFNFSGGLINPGSGSLFHVEYNSTIPIPEFSISITYITTHEFPGYEIVENINFSDTCTISVVEPDIQPEKGDFCIRNNGELGYINCYGSCYPIYMVNNYLGDGWCDECWGCAELNCSDFGYDCGDCNVNWDGSDPLGYCFADCDEGFSYTPTLPDNIQSDGNCLYTDDLVVLVDLITLNEVDYESPLYLGQQTWENGRLIHLYANDIALTQLPENINQLDSLLILDVSNNDITELPNSLWSMNTLYSLHIEHNQLTQLPIGISNMQNLHGVYLRNNYIQSIPVEFWNVPNLSSVFLSENEISGELPLEISNAQNLLWLWLEGNQLSGNIPEEICNLNPELFFGNCSGEPHFRIYGNELCPPYPDCTMEFIGYQNTEECIECSEVLGDTNNDEIVNVLDIVSLVNLLIFIYDQPQDTTCYENADMNADEIINVLDIVIMVDLILEGE